MYNYIYGKIVEINPRYLVVDSHDIGYEILVCHLEDYDLGQFVKIYLHQVVREDEIFLVGFKQKNEKDFFQKLISVKGIGPRTAVGILGATRCETLTKAIETNDLKYLKSLPGVGAKSAQQMILDLKGHLVENDDHLHISHFQEVFEALKALGFKTSEINQVLQKVDHNLSNEEIIRHCLQNLRK